MKRVRKNRKEFCEFHPDVHQTTSVMKHFASIRTYLVEHPGLYVQTDEEQKKFSKICKKTFIRKYCARLESYAERDAAEKKHGKR